MRVLSEDGVLGPHHERDVVNLSCTVIGGENAGLDKQPWNSTVT